MLNYCCYASIFTKDILTNVNYLYSACIKWMMTILYVILHGTCFVFFGMCLCVSAYINLCSTVTCVCVLLFHGLKIYVSYCLYFNKKFCWYFQIWSMKWNCFFILWHKMLKPVNLLLYFTVVICWNVLLLQFSLLN